MRRFLCTALLIIMILSMAMPAFATETESTTEPATEPAKPEPTEPEPIETEPETIGEENKNVDARSDGSTLIWVVAVVFIAAGLIVGLFLWKKKFS